LGGAVAGQLLGGLLEQRHQVTQDAWKVRCHLRSDRV
jgi:hypothetical protein